MERKLLTEDELDCAVGGSLSQFMDLFGELHSTVPTYMKKWLSTNLHITATISSTDEENTYIQKLDDGTEKKLSHSEVMAMVHAFNTSH